MKRPCFTSDEIKKKTVPWPIPIRLAKFMRESSRLSRRQAMHALNDSRVVMICDGNRREEITLSTLVFPGDQVFLDGQELVRRIPSNYFALNKPENVVSTANDPQGRPCLSTWLEQLPAGVFPVGRLDRDTTGLLLMTDDGDLAHILLHPDFHVPKEYHLLLRGHWTPDSTPIIRLRDEGVDIGDGIAQALSIEFLCGNNDSTTIAMVIDEGRHRQVRRMCKTVFLRLLHLHRERLGPITLGDVEPAKIRRLSEDEVEALWRCAGGRETARARAFAALHRQAIKCRKENRVDSRLENWLARNDPQKYWNR